MSNLEFITENSQDQLKAFPLQTLVNPEGDVTIAYSEGDVNPDSLFPYIHEIVVKEQIAENVQEMTSEEVHANHYSDGIDRDVYMHQLRSRM